MATTSNTGWIEAAIQAHVKGESTPVPLAHLAEGLVNSCVQAVAKEIKTSGLRGGLRDDRQLRAVIRGLIAADMGEHVAHAIEPINPLSPPP